MSVYTFCLNFETAGKDGYQRWVTVKREGEVLYRLSNAEGNGQHWVLFGYVSGSDTMLFSTNVNETQGARIMGHVVRKVGMECNVLGYGAAWSNACCARARRSVITGRRLTQADSIRLGHVGRDKNERTHDMRARRQASALMAMGERKRLAERATDLVKREQRLSGLGL